MTESQKQRVFSDDFKREAVLRVLNGERSAIVADDIGIRYTLLDRWRRQYVKQQEEKQRLEQEQLDTERLRRLEKHYKEFATEFDTVKTERDIAIQGILFLLDHITNSNHPNEAGEKQAVAQEE